MESVIEVGGSIPEAQERESRILEGAEALSGSLSGLPSQSNHLQEEETNRSDSSHEGKSGKSLPRSKVLAGNALGGSRMGRTEQGGSSQARASVQQGQRSQHQVGVEDGWQMAERRSL